MRVSTSSWSSSSLVISASSAVVCLQPCSANERLDNIVYPSPTVTTRMTFGKTRPLPSELTRERSCLFYPFWCGNHIVYPSPTATAPKTFGKTRPLLLPLNRERCHLFCRFDVVTTAWGVKVMQRFLLRERETLTKPRQWLDFNSKQLTINDLWQTNRKLKK